jgi:oligopeptide/dipeptide ABC transporter ATP-binding protein
MSRPSPEVVLSVNDLRTEFRDRNGSVTAVRDVSFDLRRGERIGIVGESGSGKSALALSILGLIEPPGYVAAGEIWLGGRDLRTLSERAMQQVRGREIALVLQDPMTALDPVKTIGAQLSEAIRQHQNISRAATARRAIELLREVDIPRPERRLDDYPHQYSGGMRQRVLISMALANNPSVLIADEPTTALDVTTQAQVLALLERLVDDHGAAVILITHNLGIVAEFCERIAVMYAGRFVERATTEQIFTDPRHPYTRGLLACIPNPQAIGRGPLPAIPGLPPNLRSLPPGCSFEPRCALGRGRAICVSQPPIPSTEITAPGGVQSVECHFARDARVPATVA